jgi:hypothetical protein
MWARCYFVILMAPGTMGILLGLELLERASSDPGLATTGGAPIRDRRHCGVDAETICPTRSRCASCWGTPWAGTYPTPRLSAPQPY